MPKWTNRDFKNILELIKNDGDAGEAIERMFKTWTAKPQESHIQQLEEILGEAIKKSNWSLIQESILHLEKLIEGGYPKKALGPVMFTITERIVNSHWAEAFHLLKPLLELFLQLISGCGENKRTLYVHKSLLRLLAQKIDDVEEVYVQVLALELLFRVTPADPKAKRVYAEDLGLDKEFLKITNANFPRDARNWLAKINVSSGMTQTYPIFIKSDRIYASKNGSRVLLSTDAIVDCNTTGIMIPNLTKEDADLPLEVSFGDMKRWKPQSQTEPFWIQIQMHPDWISKHQSISYLEFQVNQVQMELFEKVLRDKKVAKMENKYSFVSMSVDVIQDEEVEEHDISMRFKNENWVPEEAPESPKSKLLVADAFSPTPNLLLATRTTHESVTVKDGEVVRERTDSKEFLQSTSSPITKESTMDEYLDYPDVPIDVGIESLPPAGQKLATKSKSPQNEDEEDISDLPVKKQLKRQSSEESDEFMSKKKKTKATKKIPKLQAPPIRKSSSPEVPLESDEHLFSLPPLKSPKRESSEEYDDHISPKKKPKPSKKRSTVRTEAKRTTVKKTVHYEQEEKQSHDEQNAKLLDNIFELPKVPTVSPKKVQHLDKPLPKAAKTKEQRSRRSSRPKYEDEEAESPVPLPKVDTKKLEESNKTTTQGKVGPVDPKSSEKETRTKKQLPWSNFENRDRKAEPKAEEKRTRLLSDEFQRSRLHSEPEQSRLVADEPEQEKSTIMSLKYRSPTKYVPLSTKNVMKATLITPQSEYPNDIFERKRVSSNETVLKRPQDIQFPPRPSLSAVKQIAVDLGKIYESFVERALGQIEEHVQAVVRDNNIKDMVREAVNQRMQKTLAFRQKLLQIQQIE